MEDLERLRTELLSQAAQAPDLESLEALRVSALGKKGQITQQLKGLGGLSPEERKSAGQALNELKTALADALDSRKSELEGVALDERLAREGVDASLPVRPEREGRIHPISQTMDEVVEIFGEMGFSVAEGPDIEDDFHNPFPRKNGNQRVKR